MSAASLSNLVGKHGALDAITNCVNAGHLGAKLRIHFNAAEPVSL